MSELTPAQWTALCGMLAYVRRWPITDDLRDLAAKTGLSSHLGGPENTTLYGAYDGNGNAIGWGPNETKLVGDIQTRKLLRMSVH